MNVKRWCNDTVKKLKFSERTYPSTNLSSSNPTHIGLRLNLYPRGQPLTIWTMAWPLWIGREGKGKELLMASQTAVSQCWKLQSNQPTDCNQT